MMLPLPWGFMARNSCLMLSSVPSTLVSKMAAQLSPVMLVTGAGVPSVPAGQHPGVAPLGRDEVEDLGGP